MVSKMKIPITIQMHPGENGIAAISSMLGVLCLSVEIFYLLLSAMTQKEIANRARVLSTTTNSMNSATINGLGSIDTIKAEGVERVFLRLLL